MAEPSTSERAHRLVRAACSADVKTARRMLDAEPALARHDVWTACACGELETVSELLARQPELARQVGGPDGREPILYACFSRFLRVDSARARGIIGCVRLLLANGADPNAHYFSSDDGRRQIQTVLYGAAGVANDAELTRLLLDAGADVNELEPAPTPTQLPGMEALYHACEFHDVACVALLLAAKPYPPCVSYCLGRMLDFDNEAGAILFLKHGADPNVRIPWHANRSHLHKAAIHGRSTRTIEAMLRAGADPNAPDDLGMSAYRYAFRYGHTQLARRMEASGADPRMLTDEDRWSADLVRSGRTAGTAKHARFRPDPELVELAIKRGPLELLQAVLAAGADLTVGSEAPPLHLAAYFGRADAVALLLAAGADVQARNPYGGTALGSAEFGSEYCVDPEGGVGNRLPEEIQHGDYPRVAELLIDAGVARPPHVHGGSEAFQNVLRARGVAG